VQHSVQDIGGSILVAGNEALGPRGQGCVWILGMRAQITGQIGPFVGSVLQRNFIDASIPFTP
jgi:hypothetical protein